MGIGGNSVNGQNSSPKNWVSPVSYGGNINLGNIANGGIDQNGSSKAEGGKFDMSLKIPMPKGAAYPTVAKSTCRSVRGSGGLTVLKKSRRTRRWQRGMRRCSRMHRWSASASATGIVGAEGCSTVGKNVSS